jgi:hypothetical protein
MSERYCIMRVVPKGRPAAGWRDEDDCDLEGPCDLVLLTEQVIDDGDGIEEVEIERRGFATGHEASRHLAGLLRGGRT